MNKQRIILFLLLSAALWGLPRRAAAQDDADSTGSLSVFVHAEDTVLKLVEAANKTGSADLYDKLCERCNNEISKLFLGNTLTTEASDKGTQALGTVHKDVGRI